MTDAEVNELIKEVDQNDDGLIDYKEFLEMMRTKDATKKSKWKNTLNFYDFPNNLIAIKFN